MAEYKGTVELIGGLTPKNNGTFPLIDAKDIQVDDTGKRLDEKLAELGQDSTVTVTIDSGMGTASHGAAEIYALEQAGISLVAVMDGWHYQYDGASNFASDGECDEVSFHRTMVTEDGTVFTEHINIHDDKTTDSVFNEATGGSGEPGVDGITPHIGENGHWCIGDEDTGVNAEGAYPTALAEMGGDATKTTYRLEFSNGTGYDFEVYHGAKGNSGSSVTITEIEESTADNGENIVFFSNGKTLTVKNGKTGATGADGKAGMSAYEYASQGGYTGTEQEYAVDMNPDNIKASLSQIEAPTIVSSIDEMTDTSKQYVYKGSIWAYRTSTTEGETVLVPNFTNLIKFDASGNPSNVELNKRYSASAGAAAGYLASQDGSFAITNVITTNGSNYTLYINQKPEGQSKVINPSSINVVTINTGDWTTGENGEYKFNGSDLPSLKFSAQMSTSAITADSLKGLIVTLDEPITYTEQKTEGETVSEWYDTGISYAPTFKTDLVGVLGENNVIYLSDNLPSGTYTLKYPDNDYATVGTITK